MEAYNCKLLIYKTSINFSGGVFGVDLTAGVAGREVVSTV